MNARRKPEDDAAITAPPVATLVATDHGLVPIDDVQPGQLIRTPYGPRPIVGRRLSKRVPIITIKLSNGIILRLPSTRQVRSRGEWVEARELRRGSPVYMSRTPGPFGSRINLSLEYSRKFYMENRPTLPSVWSVELAELLGYFIAKGYINYYKIVRPRDVVILCRQEDPDVQEYLRVVIERLFNKAPSFRMNDTTPELQILSVDVAGAFNQILDEESLVNRIPRDVFIAPEPIIAGVLRGYIEGDGSVDRRSGINVPSPHLALLRDIQQLLANFGIPSTLHHARGAEETRRANYQLRLAGHRARVLYGKKIGLMSERKRAEFDRMLTDLEPKSTDTILSLPESVDLATLKPAVYQAWRTRNATIPDSLGSFFTKVAKGSKSISVRRAEWLLDILPADTQQPQALFLREAIDAAFHEVTVVSLRTGSRQSLVELAVADDSPWIADGIIVRDVAAPNEDGNEQPEVEEENNAAHRPVEHTRPTMITASVRTSRVAAGTLVATARGLEPIKNLREGESVATPMGMRRVVAVRQMPQAAAITLKLSNGMNLTCHAAQLLRSAGAWVRSGDIAVGDALYVAPRSGIFGNAVNLQLRFTTERPMDVWSKQEVTLPSKWTPELGEFVGYLLAHGRFATSKGIFEKITLTFAPEDDDLVSHFQPIISRLFARDASVRRGKSSQLHLGSVDIASAMQQLGMGHHGGDRRIPPSVFIAPEPIIAAVLRGYFQGRARTVAGSSTLALNANNVGIASDIQMLLLLFGINSSWRLTPQRVTANGSIKSGTTILYLLGDLSKKIFSEHIGLISKRRREQLLGVLDRITSADERFEGRTELLTLTPDCDLRALKDAVVRQQRPAGLAIERYRELDRVRAFIAEHLTDARCYIPITKAAWIVETLPRGIVADHAPFLLEAVDRRYVEAVVKEVLTDASEQMISILVEDDAGEYLAQGIVAHDASPNAAT